MSINDLVKEEAQRQIDLAIEEIPSDSSRLVHLIAESRFQYKNLSDFLLGFEYGHITGMCRAITETKSNNLEEEYTEEEARQVTNDISSIIVDRLPEIQQAILRAG